MYKEKFPHDELENLSEEIVFEELYRLIQEDEMEIPKDDISLQDIAAIALNNMPAKYVSSMLEKHYPRQELVDEVRDLKRYARRQVLRALALVKANPHN
jgi:competence protein ComFB